MQVNAAFAHAILLSAQSNLLDVAADVSLIKKGLFPDSLLDEELGRELGRVVEAADVLRDLIRDYKLTKGAKKNIKQLDQEGTADDGTA